MMTTNTMSVAANNDAELVSATLGGNRDAFSQIVSRYQSLICSLAYSATGSLGQSEDLAQETFITAWKHLRHLREREKLRSWLCGIARNRINSFLRREGREPNHQAEPIDEMAESHSPEPLPVDHTITKEEQAILWRSLERIPEIYREPLVLFYREHQSIEAVAEKLDLTEDTVKQRLSRGRKLLHEQVLAFVEGALGRTNPGKTFTLGVLAALPAMTYSAKAATIGAVAAKGGAAVKGAGAMGVFGAIFSPLLAIAGNYASYRMSLDEAETDEERFHVKRLFKHSLFATLVICAISALPLYLFLQGQHAPVALFASIWMVELIVVYFLTVLAFVIATLPGRQRYLRRTLDDFHGGQFPAAAYEFRSRASLFGLPLVHVRLGDRFDVIRGPVKAWIAVGSSHSIGVIFASGGVAIAPISFGGIAIGLLSFGAISIGTLALGAIALGGWAYGGAALGWDVFGGFGAGLHAAMGGMAFAGDFGVGTVIHAAQANTDAATQFIQGNWFFQSAQWLNRHGILVQLVWIIPVMLQARIVGRARRQREQAAS